MSAAFPQARHGGSSSQRWSPLNAYIKHGYVISRVVLLHERTDGRTRKRVSAHVLRVILIASRNVNQLLRIFRIVISIYSRAIHVSFLSFFFPNENFNSKFFDRGRRKEGRGNGNKLEPRVDRWCFACSLRNLRKKEDGRVYSLDSSDSNRERKRLKKVTKIKKFLEIIKFGRQL